MRRTAIWFRGGFALALAISLPRPLPASTGAEAPAYMPYCYSPQLNAPSTQPAPADTVYAPTVASVAWNGQEYAVAWVDASTQALRFRRFFADGTPAAAAVALDNAALSMGPKLLWNGSGYALSWTRSPAANTIEIRLLLLDRAGVALGPSAALGTMTATSTFYSSNIDLAWNGAQYAAVWVDTRAYVATFADIYGAVAGANGALIAGDLVLSNAAAIQYSPTVFWSPLAGQFIALYDDRSVSPGVIRRRPISVSGVPGAEATAISPPSGSAILPHAMQSNGNPALLWVDSRSGSLLLHFQRLDANGAPIGGFTVVNGGVAVTQITPHLTWTGAEYAAFWVDPTSGTNEIWMQRISAAGALQGGNLQLTTSIGSVSPSAAFARYGFLLASLTGGPFAADKLTLTPIGCAYDYSPPVCSGGYLAYAITGTTASLAWTPSDDSESDLAYYAVYRNGALQGRTSDTYFNDSGLGLGTTYGYAIQPVNAAQMRNATCTQLLYVKTGASLTLSMNKSQPDALLHWTDAGLANYSVFRGTDPRVMQQIGQTPALATTDPNALVDAVSYFYTVDDPGP
jgi:hypothetical protein